MSIKEMYLHTCTICKKVGKDNVSVFSAQAAFFIILAFFPFIMFLLTLVQYLPIRESVMLRTFTDIMPKAINPYIVLIVSEVYDHATTTITSVTAITALWSASKGFLGLVRGLNSVYGISETRNYIKLRLMSAFYTLGFTILLIITLLILVFGRPIYVWVENWHPELINIALVIISFRTAVAMLLLTSYFVLIFLVIPNRKTRLLAELPGALIAAAGWLIFSFGFSFYIDHMGGFSSTYGSLTAIILLMLWFYFCMYILFIGAEFNVYLAEKKKKAITK